MSPIKHFEQGSTQHAIAANMLWTLPPPAYHSAPIESSPLFTSVERWKEHALAVLDELIIDLEDDYQAHGDSEAQEPNAVSNSRDIFIVHGHDEGPREAVSRYLEKLSLNPIVLHEQASMGRTIIEKFEHHGDVAFAIVLLTPDDVGGLDSKNVRGRARQNVILELGYFIGRLGRDKVCAIKKGDVELPSDALGIIWVDYDGAGGVEAITGERN